MNKKYRTNRYVCPFCGADDTDPNPNLYTDRYGYEFDDAFVYHFRHCNECGTSYRITYRPCKAERM